MVRAKTYNSYKGITTQDAKEAIKALEPCKDKIFYKNHKSDCSGYKKETRLLKNYIYRQDNKMFAERDKENEKNKAAEKALRKEEKNEMKEMEIQKLVALELEKMKHPTKKAAREKPAKGKVPEGFTREAVKKGAETRHYLAEVRKQLNEEGFVANAKEISSLWRSAKNKAKKSGKTPKKEFKMIILAEIEKRNRLCSLTDDNIVAAGLVGSGLVGSGLVGSGLVGSGKKKVKGGCGICSNCGYNN